jgi:hypothetical protein
LGENVSVAQLVIVEVDPVRALLRVLGASRFEDDDDDVVTLILLIWLGFC